MKQKRTGALRSQPIICQIYMFDRWAISVTVPTSFWQIKPSSRTRVEKDFDLKLKVIESALEETENMEFTPLFLSSVGTVGNLDEQLLFCDTRFCPRGTFSLGAFKIDQRKVTANMRKQQPNFNILRIPWLWLKNE